MLWATGQYWAQYIDLMNIYRLLCRATRTGNFNLYLYCLPKITSFFFCFNHQNYARYLTLYKSNLLQLDSTHPEVYQDFANGLFSLARTKKNFSQQPIDLVLEQTVNADSASQLHGITPLTNSIPARLRWTDSHFWCTKRLSNLLEDFS